jgi:uncharacterized protein (TIGR00369 family)
MPDLATVRSLLTEAIPFNRVLGIRVESVAEEQAEVTLPASPEHLNPVGTVHAAAQFGLGEAASGAMLLAAFGDLQAAGAVPLAQDALIRYRAPARGELRAVASLPGEGRERIRQEVRETGRAHFTIPVKVYDADGKLTTELEVGWVLLLKRTN